MSRCLLGSKKGVDLKKKSCLLATEANLISKKMRDQPFKTFMTKSDKSDSDPIFLRVLYWKITTTSSLKICCLFQKRTSLNALCLGFFCLTVLMKKDGICDVCENRTFKFWCLVKKIGISWDSTWAKSHVVGFWWFLICILWDSTWLILTLMDRGAGFPTASQWGCLWHCFPKMDAPIFRWNSPSCLNQVLFVRFEEKL